MISQEPPARAECAAATHTNSSWADPQPQSWGSAADNSHAAADSRSEEACGEHSQHAYAELHAEHAEAEEHNAEVQGKAWKSAEHSGELLDATSAADNVRGRKKNSFRQRKDPS